MNSREHAQALDGNGREAGVMAGLGQLLSLTEPAKNATKRK